VRLSRLCYDKPRRCPGWAGGGWLYAKVPRCDGGHIQLNFNDPYRRWKFHRCDSCDVLALPYLVRWLEWETWRWEGHSQWNRYQNWRELRAWRKERKRG
jgi:hypothetical protein